MKWVWVFIAVLLVPVSVQAGQDDPQTVEQCETMNTNLQALTLRLVAEGVQCQQDIRSNQAAIVDLTPCGPCCESVHGKPGEDPLSPGGLHNCLFPQTCAANREQQYCALTKWMAVRKICQSDVVGYDDAPWAKADQAAYKSMYEGVKLKTEALMNGVLKPLEELKDKLHQRQKRENLKKKTSFSQ